MKSLSIRLFGNRSTCPSCGSSDTTQTHFDGNDGFNQYTCNKCDCTFGN